MLFSHMDITHLQKDNWKTQNSGDSLLLRRKDEIQKRNPELLVMILVLGRFTGIHYFNEKKEGKNKLQGSHAQSNDDKRS